MRVAKLGEIRQTAETIDRFRGYNHNMSIGSGEWYREENMSADGYPTLCVRERRRRYYASVLRMTGICWLDGIWVTSGSGITRARDGLFIDLGLTDGRKQLIPFGVYIIVMPDRVYVNTTDPDDHGVITKSADFLAHDGGNWVRINICDAKGHFLSAAVASEEAPDTESLWLQPSTMTLRRRNEDKWVEEEYFTAISFGAGEPIHPPRGTIEDGDTVRFTVTGGDGWDADELNGLSGGNIKIKAYYPGQNLAVVEHRIGFTYRYFGADSISFDSPMPIMDFVFEHDNRLWGCRYGVNVDGEFVNEIYASKQGDFKSWSAFEGISTDSYVMSCGTDGPWTGAMEVGGYPTFWKERYLHKVYGDYPAQYSCSPAEVNGVAPGEAASMAIVDGVLYYSGVFGVCRYDGSLPTEISEAFGGEKFSGGVAGVLGKKYYCSFRGALMCYDTEKRIWHRESPIDATAMCYGSGELHYIKADGDAVGLICNGNTDDNDPGLEQPVKWFFETGIIGSESYQQKRLQRIDLRMALGIGTRVRIMAEYDSGGVWEPIAAQLTGMALKTFTVPLRPKRCDHLRLRLEGEGEMRLMKITYITEKGSDIR